MQISLEFLRLLGICALLALIVPVFAHLFFDIRWEFKAYRNLMRRINPKSADMIDDFGYEDPSFGRWLYVLIVILATLIIGAMLVSRMNLSDKDLDVPQTPFHRFPPAE